MRTDARSDPPHGGAPDARLPAVRRVPHEILITDGPFAETKEVLGGLSIIRVADLDEALRWAGELTRATSVPIEVRPFVDAAG